MAQKPITAESQIQLDPHDKFTDALSIDGVFVGYVSKPVAQYIRLASADVAAHDATKAQLATAQAERDATREALELETNTLQPIVAECLDGELKEVRHITCDVLTPTPAAPATAQEPAQ